MKVNIVILDKNKYLEAKKYLKNENFDIILGDLLNQKGILVTAGNSFGFMDGGLDLEFIKKYGWELQDKVQTIIKNTDLKELLIGQNIIVDLPDNNKLIYAPTMRVPQILDFSSINPYLVLKGILATCKKENIEEVNIPLLCEGVGRMPILTIMSQLQKAYDDFYDEYYPINWWDSSKKHQNLLGIPDDICKDLQIPEYKPNTKLKASELPKHNTFIGCIH